MRPSMQRKVRNPKKQRWLARRRRVLKQIERSDRVRLTVYRSLRHIYALLVDPETGRTIGSVSTRTPSVASSLKSAGQKSSGNVEAARAVGKAVAELARSKGIEKVVFNRNGYLYHGRVKALADAAREAGLDF